MQTDFNYLPSFRRTLTWARARSLLGVVIVLATMMQGGCNDPPVMENDRRPGSEDDGEQDFPRILTVRAEPRDLMQRIEVPGTVEGFEKADLFAKVGGYLQSITVDIGDQVQKDDVLATLAIPEMEKELQQKQAAIIAAKANVAQFEAAMRKAAAQVNKELASLEEAKALEAEKQAQLEFHLVEYQRMRGLVENNSLSQNLLDEALLQRKSSEAAVASVRARIRTAKAELETARAEEDKVRTDRQSSLARVDLAQADYDRVQTLSQYAIIRAPFNGVVTRRYVDPGAFVQPAEGNSAARPLVTLTQLDRVRIRLDVPMAQVRWLNRGDPVVFDRINVLPGDRFEGEVSRYAVALNADSRMMRVEVDLPNPDHRLRPGYYGYVTLLLDEFPQTPVVPSSALFTSDSRTCVYVVDDGVCQKRRISTNYEDGEIVGISSGLQVGEQVVQAGAGQLYDGQKVIPVTAPSQG